jgi:FkbM family methyltransferase
MTLAERVVRKVRQTLLLSGGGRRTVAVQANGLVAKFDIGTKVELYRTVEFGGERDFLSNFVAALSPEDVVLDVGASVGLVAIFSGLAGATVDAIEPDPDTYSRLKRNIDLNALSNVSPVQLALGDEVGEAILFSDGAAGRAPTLRAQAGRTVAPRGTIKVQTSTIDKEIEARRLRIPTVVKIDVEGAETMVLKGAKGLLSGAFGRPPRRLFIELHPEFLPSFQSSETEAVEILTSYGGKRLSRDQRGDQVHEVYTFT